MNTHYSTYERLKRKERYLKDIVLFTVIGVPAIVGSLTNSVIGLVTAFLLMFIPGWIMYALIIKHFDDIYIAHQNSGAFHHPRDKHGRFINE